MATGPSHSWMCGYLGADLFLLKGCDVRSLCKRAGGLSDLHTEHKDSTSVEQLTGTSWLWMASSVCGELHLAPLFSCLRPPSHSFRTVWR